MPSIPDFTFDDAELAEIAKEAYLFFYPLVLMDLTRRASLVGRGDERVAMNSFQHLRTFPSGEFKTIVRPNFDTLYSSAWIDVSAGPVIVSLPALPPDRFFMLPCYDMWTEVFASPGTRTSGFAPYSFALCDPTWRGELPDGVERIDAPTPVVWMIGRTATFGEADYDYVRSFQDQLTITTLAELRGETVTSPEESPSDEPPRKGPPMIQVQKMPAAEFMARAAALVATHRPHATDWNTVARLRHVGFNLGEPYDLSAQPSAVQEAFESAAQNARDEMLRRFSQLAPRVNGWSTNTHTMGVWGNFYLKRAAVAMVGLGANPPEESLYPSCEVDADGAPLSGEHSYVLHFTAEELPPVKSFWSITAYDQQGYTVPNSLQRYALGSLSDLAYNDDGSLDLYFAHEAPPAGDERNWLPVGRERFLLTMRLYLPETPVFDGRWQPPVVRAIN